MCEPNFILPLGSEFIMSESNQQFPDEETDDDDTESQTSEPPTEGDEPPTPQESSAEKPRETDSATVESDTEPDNKSRRTSDETADDPEDMYSGLEEFRGYPIFEDLGPEAIKIIVDDSNRIRLTADETLFEEGDSAEDNFYLILEGELNITKYMRTRTTQVTIMEEGESVGEFGLFTQRDRMAGVQARTNAELLEISKTTLDKLRETDPESLTIIYENMYEALSKRFRSLAQKAEKAQFWL